MYGYIADRRLLYVHFVISFVIQVQEMLADYMQYR